LTFCRSPFELSALELASGLVFGAERRARPAAPESVADPLVALERVLLPALERGPCLVSFSGGRDSSAVLAAAAAAARREGLPLPVPATNVFPDVKRSAETEWQEIVVDHLRLDDWVRIELRDELDCVGPIAKAILERHGLLWPFNAHFHWPMLNAARGGTLLTGIGGDELLGTSHWARAAAVLSGAAAPRFRDVPRALVAVAPYALRRAVMRRRYPGATRLDWLTDRANSELRRRSADDLASEPFRWSDRWRWWHERRETEIGLRSLDLIAKDCQAMIAHPLTDSAFAASVARFAARRRLHERTSLLRAIFSPLLPASVLGRTTKAAFGPVFWGVASRLLASDAAEELGDVEPVDRTALRDTWSGEAPDAHSFLLLQAALVRRSTGLGEAASRNLHFRTVASD
jgi:hypothetical protein